MKINVCILLMSLILCGCFNKTSKDSNNYKGSPVIKATEKVTDFKVGSRWMRGRWSVAPHIKSDTLNVTLYGSSESFVFKTNVDSIAFQLESNAYKDFYVLLNDSLYAHTVIHGVPFKTQKIEYDTEKTGDVKIAYQKDESPYLEQLKKEYPIDYDASNSSDIQSVLSVLNWTNSRWQHNGNNSPKKNDAISILKEAEGGAQFPCFAYAIVLRDQLNALGFRARTIYLKSKDAKTRQSSPGHVATEVYLNDLKKWVFLDGQFNVLPTLNGVPLSAVEFQKAISEEFEVLKLESLSDKAISKAEYVDFVYDYLYYLDTSLEHRYDITKPFTSEGKSSLMLVPLGAENLTHINFWNLDINYCIYTNSLRDFYAEPEYN